MVMALMALTWIATGTALATDSPSCCACLEGKGVVGGGLAQGPPAVPALFCSSSADRVTEVELSERCAGLGGSLACFVDGVDPCLALLAEQGIACPLGTPAAPLLSPLVLGGLALALGGLGVALTRRHARR
jgi:hypothetical protein